ncbi:hypothetical protein CDAR_266391 [Caerostris darwini]|uniref:Uncharacterized protein n=1 Tax=Caerostris darwini TaxID=1538125 RepID=A0AAV4Q1S7_9ARAC|nr:hypothetical protein CDAR_266391 [Caerostris darwini]
MSGGHLKRVPTKGSSVVPPPLCVSQLNRGFNCGYNIKVVILIEVLYNPRRFAAKAETAELSVDTMGILLGAHCLQLISAPSPSSFDLFALLFASRSRQTLAFHFVLFALCCALSHRAFPFLFLSKNDCDDGPPGKKNDKLPRNYLVN